jgi:hypothetical protein
MQARLEEVFTSVKGITDTYTSSGHFSVAKLGVIESVVLAAMEALTRPDEPSTVTDNSPS